MSTFFHISFSLIFIAFFGIRAYYHKKAADSRGEVKYKEGPWHNWLRKIIGVPFMLYFLAFLIRSNLLEWARFPLPLWAQWLGLVLGAVSLPLLWWVQWALDINFSTTLHVRKDHTLVTHGPYHWVRHPMYTVLYLHLIAILLLTANWFIGGTLLVMQTIIIALRLKNEEAAMVEKFGDKYREYMKQTGRFLPKLSL